MRLTLRRVSLVVAVSAAVVLLTTVDATAREDPPTPACGAYCQAGTEQHRDSGTLVAAAEGQPGVDVTVSGAGYPSRSASTPTPARVLPPCYYRLERSAADMARQYNDPLVRQLLDQSGMRPEDSFPPDVLAHANDDGNWYSLYCGYNLFKGEVPVLSPAVEAWAASLPPETFVDAGDPVPSPPIPETILSEIASQVLSRMVVMPLVHFNPAERTVVGLDTWTWIDPAAWHPLSVTASAGAASVTVTATPGAVGFDGLPTGSKSVDTCTSGGQPYAEQSSTDCLIRFGRSSGGQPGRQWTFSVSLTWNVTAVGAPLTGPPTIVTREDDTLQVGEVQVVGSNIRRTPTDRPDVRGPSRAEWQCGRGSCASGS
jgi:hypothetical protein